MSKVKYNEESAYAKYYNSCNPPPTEAEKSAYAVIKGGYNNDLSAGYSSFKSSSMSDEDKKKLDEDLAFNYKPSIKEIKNRLYDILDEDLKEQCKRDIKFTAAKTDSEKIDLLYFELQSVNKGIYNIQRILIDKLI